MLTPRLSARIGLSRSAAKARPHGERSSHHSSATSRTVKNSVNQKNGSAPSSEYPSNVGPRNVGNAERAAGDLLFVAHHEKDQHVEAERREREIVVLHPQRRKAERQADREACDGGERQHDEERHARP